jgi:hypothetical protein
MLVVTEDLIGCARVKYRQTIDPVQDLLQLGEYNFTAPLAPQAFEAFFEGFLDGSGHGFSGLRGDFPGEPFDLYALYTHCHRAIV